MLTTLLRLLFLPCLRSVTVARIRWRGVEHLHDGARVSYAFGLSIVLHYDPPKPPLEVR